MTLPIDRRYKGVGRIKKASGTTDRKTLRRILGAFDGLEARGRIDILVAVRNGHLSPLQVYDAVRRDGVDSLPTSETLRALESTWEQWIEVYPCSESHRQDLRYTMAAVIRCARSGASLEALPSALAAYRDEALLSRTPRQFNKARANAQAFVRRTLGRSHRLWWAVTGIDRLPEVRAIGTALLPDELAERIAPLPEHIRRMAWSLDSTGMGRTEYWDRVWQVDGEMITIAGTKREGRHRVVPLFLDLHAPAVEYPAFRRHLLKVGLKSYDLRRSYARTLEAARVPLSRIRAYMGHGARTVTELYPRHSVLPYLSEDRQAVLPFYRNVNGSP